MGVVSIGEAATIRIFEKERMEFGCALWYVRVSVFRKKIKKRKKREIWV